VVKFVSDLREVGVFFHVLPVSSTNKTDSHDKTEILLKVAFGEFITKELFAKKSY
jgi:hypothetical protein